MATPFQIGCPNSPALCLKSDRLLGYNYFPPKASGAGATRLSWASLFVLTPSTSPHIAPD